MNIIKTVGDLKKALSVYDDELPLVFAAGGHKVNLNNDTQIIKLLASHEKDSLLIDLV